MVRNDGQYIPVDVNNEDFMFLWDLIRRHPEHDTKFKNKTMINGFRVIRNMNNSIACNIVYDFREDSFSWRKCVSAKKTTHAADLKQALRNEVAYQVQEFKDNNYKERMSCPRCLNEIDNRRDAHVDHKDRSFKDLYESFTGNFKFLPKEFESNGNHIGHVLTDTDSYFRDAWRQFHKQNATYQILCAKCNIKKK